MPDDERELQAMKWGLVPSWYRGDPSSFGYKMNNARIESITEKKSFKGALEKGRRCVVLAEGLVFVFQLEHNKMRFLYCVI